MKEEKIKDITIRYTENEDIARIKNIIENNYSIIFESLPSKKTISFLETSDKDIEYVADFDKFFIIIVLAHLKFYEEQNPLENISTYLLYLVNKLDKMHVSHIQIPSSMTFDEIYFLMVKEYYQENIDLLIYELENRFNKEEIVNWFIDKMRYPTYEYLLKEQVKCLGSLDLEYLENINVITEKFFEQMVSDLKYNDLEKEEKLPDVSLEEVDVLFKEFLKKIKAPAEWLKFYQNLMDKGFICYKEPEDGKVSKCYVDKDGNLKIKIYGKGLMAFKTLCHEFGHYVAMYKGNKNVKPSITEFPSIFLEYLAIGFLKFKGYNDNILAHLLKRRTLNNFYIMQITYSILNDMADLYKNNEDFMARKIAKAKKTYEDMKDNGKLKDLIKSLEDFSYNPEEVLKSECDFSTMLIIKDPTIILESYQYLLGTYLTKETIIKYCEDDSIIKKVYIIIQNLENENLKSVIDTLNIQDVLINPKTRQSL